MALDNISDAISQRVEEFFSPGRCWVVYQTGPWEGPGSWLYRGYCLPHGWEDFATNLEDITVVGRAHRDEWDGIEVEEF